MRFSRFQGIILALFICQCDNTDESSSNFTGGCGASSLTVNKNLHSSLPIAWQTEFETIYQKLNDYLPLSATYYNQVDIYAWNDSTADPYPGIAGGAYIGGSACIKDFVMEISQQELANDSDYHKYSVIVHEYFHLYQLALNGPMNKPNDDPAGFDIKWLTEGTAASFESMYMNEHYSGQNYFNAQNTLNSTNLANPSSLESFNASNETNYSDSVYLTLVLIKELEAAGDTTEQAIRKIFKTFMETQPNNQDWKTKFNTTFGFTVDTFYGQISSYRGNASTDTVLELVPSTIPAISAIF